MISRDGNKRHLRGMGTAPVERSSDHVRAAVPAARDGKVPWHSVHPADGELPAFSLSWIAGIIELIGGVLLVIGLFTRPVAFLASGMTAFAYFIAHAPRGFYPIANAGELAVLYCFVFLYIAAAGAGPWSFDAILKRK